MPLISVAVVLLTPALALAAEDSNIAYAAAITATPAPSPGSLQRTVDGRLGTALSFEVGTEGEGTVTFSFDRQRLVLGVRLYQGSDIYYTTAYVIEADRDGDGKFEETIAEGDNAPTKEWIEHKWERRGLRALRFRSVAGVSKGRRAHPCIAEFQILGRPEADDMEKAAEAGIVVPALVEARRIERTTWLVVNGKPPAVMLPEGEEYQQARAALTQGLRAAGVSAEVAQDIEAAVPADRTVICLGNMLNGPLIERLYWNRYTFADALTPGPGKYLLHTVYDPYPYNGGNNVIIIGCSDAAGAGLGVERFLAAIEDGKLPYVAEVGPEPAVSDAEARKIAAKKLDPTLCELTENANKYLQTGCEAYARKAIAALEIVSKLYEPGGDRNNPSAGRHMVLPWNEETTSWEITCAWDAFEECPLMTDDQRLKFSNALLRFTRDLVRHVSGYGGLGRGDLVTWNHTTFPLLGCHFGARYFHRYYKLADMPEMLAKAKACFLAQAKSWKPQEDADSYLPLTPEHTAVYCLAEDEMEHFTSGNLKHFADYVVAICDNSGLASGFGDSGVSARPNIPMGVLPLALWWTKDPGYKWLMQQYSNNTWENPYERGIKAERPDRLVGVNAFMLDKQVYEYTQTRPYYNEPLVPSEVPLEQAYDKISFRENWDPDGQYLLLDGFARGKHLHYDGNSITEFVEGGERWLLDHDYLTRNTTEHTMLSVLRKGRCDSLEPSMSALLAKADLPGFGYTRTAVSDYNGCDWERQILWRKGGYFLVADTVIPREADEYDLELTWKTIDCAGEQRIVNGSDFVAERGAGSARTHDCVLADDPDASGGKALVMDRSSSRIAFGVDLPEGEYSLAVIGYGVDTSSDSLWISVDLGPKQAFGMPKLRYGRSASDHALTTPTPRVTLEGPGPHLIIVTLRERPPLRVDRFIFQDAAGKNHVYEAEDLPPAPQASVDLAKRLLIKPATPLTAWVTNHERQGIAVPVSILHQRKAGAFQAGEAVRFASLMYTSLPARRRDHKPVQLDDNLIAIQGSDPALALLGEVNGHGIMAKAESGLLTPESITVCGLSELRVGDLTLSSSGPTDLTLDLKTGKISAEAPGPAQLTVSLAGVQQTLAVKAGQQDIQLEGFAGAARVAETLRGVIEGARPRVAQTPAAAGDEITEPAWSAFEPGGQIERIKTADLQDGTGERIFVCHGPSLVCLSPEGEQLWKFDANGRVRDVAFGDMRETPGHEVLIGSADTYVYILSSEGKLLDKHQMRGTPWARSFGDRAWGVYNLGAWDITGDGKLEILATTRNFYLKALSADWELLWEHDYALHGSMQMSFEDTNGDGKPDTIFLADKYGSSVGIRPDGRRAHRTYTSIGDVFYAVADINGDGKAEVVTGSSTGDMIAAPFGQRTEPHWRFDNFGYPVNRLGAGDVNGDGVPEIILASGTGYLYVLDGSGKTAWQDRAGYCVNDAIIMGEGDEVRIAYCDESGLVRIADGKGKTLRDIRPPSPPRLLASMSRDDGKQVLVALADGRLMAYPLP